MVAGFVTCAVSLVAARTIAAAYTIAAFHAAHMIDVAYSLAVAHTVAAVYIVCMILATAAARLYGMMLIAGPVFCHHCSPPLGASPPFIACTRSNGFCKWGVGENKREKRLLLVAYRTSPPSPVFALPAALLPAS